MPRSKKHTVEFANFICKFGPKINMVDLADEIVLPALLSGQIRKHGKSRWVLLDPLVTELGDGNYGITFEFVKDTALERSQILNSEMKLQDDARSMRSAPSAICLLVLNTHRLVYMPKTAHAPNISELEATCQHLIGLYRDRFIDAKLIDVPRGEKIKSKLDLEIRFPRPEINIVPLASSVSINKAISQFSVLKEFSVTLVDTNNEIDSSDFFRKFREQREDLGATGTALSHTNSKEGLNRRAAAKELEAAMGSGSSYIKLSGIDKDGLAMKRTNQDISLREPATFEPSTPKENSINLFFALSRVISRGIVAAPRFAADAGKKLATFITKHMRRSAGAAPPVKELPDHTVAPARVLEAKPVVESPTKKTRARKR